MHICTILWLILIKGIASNAQTKDKFISKKTLEKLSVALNKLKYSLPNDLHEDPKYQPSEVQENLPKLRELSQELQKLGRYFGDVADGKTENYKPHLFITIPMSREGMNELKKFLGLALFDPIRCLSEGTFHTVTLKECELYLAAVRKYSIDHVINLDADDIPMVISLPELPDVYKLFGITKEMTANEPKSAAVIRSLIQDFEKMVLVMGGPYRFTNPALLPHILQHMSKSPSLEAVMDMLQLAYGDLLVNSQANEVSFREIHSLNKIYRHDTSGIMFGEILAKAVHEVKPPENFPIPDGPVKNPLLLLASLLRRLEYEHQNQRYAGDIAAALVHHIDLAIKSKPAHLLLKKKTRSDHILQPKSEL